jgi:hypothetical protein
MLILKLFKMFLFVIMEHEWINVKWCNQEEVSHQIIILSTCFYNPVILVYWAREIVPFI